MSGFDNGTLQGGVFFQAKQFGSILRGSGPPVPEVGVSGDLYIDITSWNLYGRRASGLDPWGHYFFVVPVTYRAALKWFSASQPSKDLGVNGDYCLLWGGYPNYGMQPSILGPKASGAWPASPTAVAVTLNNLYTAEDQHDISNASSAPILINTATYTITSPGTYYVNFAGAVDITLAPSATVGNNKISIKDTSGAAFTNNVRVRADVGDTYGVDGQNPYTINTDYGAVDLTPATLGYAVT